MFQYNNRLIYYLHIKKDNINRKKILYSIRFQLISKMFYKKIYIYVLNKPGVLMEGRIY